MNANVELNANVEFPNHSRIGYDMSGNYAEQGYLVLAFLNNTSHGRSSRGHVVVIACGDVHECR